MPGFTTRPEIRGTFGVVASTHWLASAVGMSILEKGGNAFDASAAAGFTLQVVEPSTNGPLGEAPMLVWSEANRRCDMICGQGVAPAAATIAKFRDLGLDLIPGTGLLAAAVPAAFDAWMRLLRDYGTMPLGETQTWPAWRALTALACVCIGVAMRQIVLKTRFGMRVRAGASNAEMVEALGIDVRRLFAIVFSAGTALAGFAGMLAAPLTTVYPGMGENVLILSFVVVVIGGIGSIKGAFFGALLVGLADTFGKVLLPGFASAIVYAVMAAVLLWRPRGLLGPAFEGR